MEGKKFSEFTEKTLAEVKTANGFIAGVSDGDNVKIAASEMPAVFKLRNYSTSSWTGTSYIIGLNLDTLTDFGEIPANVTSLTLNATEAASSLVSQAAAQFSLATGTAFTTLTVNLGSTACKMSNVPSSWESGKTYQVSMINGCAVVGVFA